jgi:hypothetical protein
VFIVAEQENFLTLLLQATAKRLAAPEQPVRGTGPMTNVAAIAGVNRANFREALAALLEECRRQLLTQQNESSTYRLYLDLTTAVQALELIDKEIREGHQRAKGLRSTLFTRYVIEKWGQVLTEDINEG